MYKTLKILVIIVALALMVSVLTAAAEGGFLTPRTELLALTIAPKENADYRMVKKTKEIQPLKAAIIKDIIKNEAKRKAALAAMSVISEVVDAEGGRRLKAAADSITNIDQAGSAGTTSQSGGINNSTGGQGNNTDKGANNTGQGKQGGKSNNGKDGNSGHDKQGGKSNSGKGGNSGNGGAKGNNTQVSTGTVGDINGKNIHGHGGGKQRK